MWKRWETSSQHFSIDKLAGQSKFLLYIMQVMKIVKVASSIISEFARVMELKPVEAQLNGQMLLLLAILLKWINPQDQMSFLIWLSAWLIKCIWHWDVTVRTIRVRVGYVDCLKKRASCIQQEDVCKLANRWMSEPSWASSSSLEDRQYFHYLKKWMLVLNRLSVATNDSIVCFH